MCSYVCETEARIITSCVEEMLNSPLQLPHIVLSGPKLVADCLKKREQPSIASGHWSAISHCLKLNANIAASIVNLTSKMLNLAKEQATIFPEHDQVLLS